MLDSKIRGLWERVMGPVGRAIGRTSVSPNLVTMIGVVVQVGVAALILDGRLLAAGLVAILSGLLDAVDGAVARSMQATTKFGALLDSTTDRLSDALFFAPIAWLYGVAPDTAAHDHPWVAAIALVALIASFLVSYIKARAESLGFTCNVGIAERAERLIIVILALIFDALLPALLLLLAGLSVVTVVQRVGHVYKQARAA